LKTLYVAPSFPTTEQPVPAPDNATLKELVPTGTLRAAINLGNSVLAQQDAAGALGGVTVDLSRELAKRLGLPVEFKAYPGAGKVFEDVKNNVWDIAFVAIEPVRAAEIEFTPPYVIIEGTYMVEQSSPLKVVADVDKPGIRIAAGGGSAYELYLTRTIKNATIVRAAQGGGRAMIELFLKDKLEVVAGVRQQLEAFVRDRANFRIMDGAFMEIRQAMGVPKGRTAAAHYLAGFIEEMKTSGFIADALKRSKQSAKVPGPAA
jgi:polar amino acid transport system substrate-binding protein